MSGAGFYRYRCKYFYTHNCPNWVWVNNAPCAGCLADGRDAQEPDIYPARLSREIVVPRVLDGVLQYTMMELVAPTEPGDNWTLRDKESRPAPFPSISSTGPEVPNFSTFRLW